MPLQTRTQIEDVSQSVWSCDQDRGRRLDQVLQRHFPAYSRTKLQHWLKSGRVSMDGVVVQKADFKLSGSSHHLTLQAEHGIEVGHWIAEPGALKICFEDEHLWILDKPADLSVHPGAGRPSGTLANHLLHHAPQLAHLPRAGLVHRLDKGTTGLMIVAKSLVAQTALVRQIQARAIHREYRALVEGWTAIEGRMDQPIGRDPRCRIKMAVVPGGKPAQTSFMRLAQGSEGARRWSYLKVRLETGRTHQIRVHCAYLKHPLMGDVCYGGRAMLSENVDAEKLLWRRPALHAHRLSFAHPILANEQIEMLSPLPEDFQKRLDFLQRTSRCDSKTN